MRFLTAISALAFSLLALSQAAQVPFTLDTAIPTSDASTANKWTSPRASNNSAVVYDRYSLALAGGKQRLFVLAAEFHPWRLPVPSLWRDVLQKVKVAGFNTVSIYTHWGLIQTSSDPTSIHLTGVNDLDYFLTVAKEEGLFVIVRPGPYINAETTVGGMAPWTVNINAVLRTNDTEWQKAWKPYIEAISNVVVKHQLVYEDSKAEYLRGGSVIMVQADNEYRTGGPQRAYMTELVDSFKRWGVTVPISYNDPSREANFVDIVDLYGLDSYPQRFDCSHPETWVALRDDYLQYHLETNPDQPFYIPEFQGGSYDPYDGPGYGPCRQMTDARFVRVADQALIAQRVTLLSIYMVYGGTNWGGLAEPDVYSSYDYGAALTESRQPTDKYGEYKSQGNFIAAFPDLAQTDQILDGPGINITYVADVDDPSTEVSSKILRTTVLRNPQTGSRFYIVRHDNSTLTRKTRFTIEIETMGDKAILGPKLDDISERMLGVNYINGRDSHIIVVDQRLPFDLMLRYSTANVYRVATIDNVLSIDFDAEPGQVFQFSFYVQNKQDRITSVRMFSIPSSSGSQVKRVVYEEEEMVQKTTRIADDGRLVSGYVPRFADGELYTRHILYTTALGYQVLIAFSPNSVTRRNFAVKTKYAASEGMAIMKERISLVDHFFGYSSDSVIVQNVDMLLNATYASSKAPLDTLQLWGSAAATSFTNLIALPTLKKVYWNGRRIELVARDDLPFFYSIQIPGPSDKALSWEPPSLSSLSWKAKDSIPEATHALDFDDSHWTPANKTSSFNPYSKDPSIDTQGDILFASEYGYHGNNIVWRGAFELKEASPMPSNLHIKLEGGKSFAFSVWINGEYLGSAEADRESSTANLTVGIPTGKLRKQTKNVITVLQDHMGIEMESGPLPVGIRSKSEPMKDGGLELEAVKLPRGIVGFSFPSIRAAQAAEPKVHWKVQGNYLGEQAPDTVRRSLNEGGLFAEVQGWHLPGFHDSSWDSCEDVVRESSRVMFYRTTVSIETPKEHDIGLGFTFVGPDGETKKRGKNFRAQIYVNGWQMGRYINNLGPQITFPVHDGILNQDGEDNTIGVSVWNLDDDGDWTFDPSTDLKLEVLHRITGQPRDGYGLSAPTWKQLR